MVKRKKADGDDLEGEQTIPIPIQTFLWRQSSPFIRPKMGKLCDSSCVSFERVLVQNITHGLSPGLCDAIESVSRWKVIQAALPHVIHCCSAVLTDRKNTSPDTKFGTNETKLLYTLHWIILDAASECEDFDNEQNIQRSVHTYLHPLDTIQLFIYLMAPIISSMRDSDFQSLKLENGLRLWQPLWNYQQPDVPCFSTPVKAKRVVLKAQRNLLKVNFNLANIYIGKGTSNDDIYLGFDDPSPESRGSAHESTTSPHAPLCRMSDICALSTTETATSHASVELICEICNQTVQQRNGELVCECGVRRTSHHSVPSQPAPTGLPSELGSPLDREYMAKRLEVGTFAATTRAEQNPDILSATYFDVAVLRCLFCPQWTEEGIYWALRYVHGRLLEVCDEMNMVQISHRERSKSLPTPELEITPPEVVPPPTPPPTMYRVQDDRPLEEKSPEKSPKEDKDHRQPAFKRMRVSEIKNIIGDKVKMLRRRESVEQFDPDLGRDGSSSGRASPEYLSTEPAEGLPRPNSALAKLNESTAEGEDSYVEDDESGDSSSDIIRRKSMPALRRHKKPMLEDEDDDSSGSGKHDKEKRDSVVRTLSLKPELLTKPIITITADSPEPDALPAAWASKRESVMSERVEPAEPPQLQRSYTDTNINYNSNEEVEEVSGSVHYIQANGQLNYHVILEAAHTVSLRETCSARICGVLLNILNCLLDLDLGIIEKKEKKEKKSEDDQTEKENNFSQHLTRDEIKKPDKPDADKKTKTGHNKAMETAVRVFRALGCPHGCGDGFRGSVGDHLRVQGINCLNRLMKTHTIAFKKFIRELLMKQQLQEVMDFLHAFLGFCVDPATAAYSPQGATGGLKKGSSQDGGKTGYANNFGEPFGGSPTVQGQIIANIMKPLVTKFVENRKDLQNHENMGLYCDIRQFLNYVKEIHGGTFRKVALSGLMDALHKETKNKDAKTTTKVVRRTLSMASDNGEDRASHTSKDESAKSRRSIFGRKPKKVLPPPSAVSDSETLDETPRGYGSGRLSPRVSMSANEDDPPSGPSTPKRKFSKFNLAWKRATKSDYEDDSATESNRDSPHETRKGANAAESSSSSSQPASQKKRMSFKAAGQATLTFLSARKRIEDGLKNWSKRRSSKRGSIDEGSGLRKSLKLSSSSHSMKSPSRERRQHLLPELTFAAVEQASEGSRRGSHDVTSSLGTELIIVREKKLINSYAVKSGMFRFNFMLDCCQPGSIPDPNLVASLLDLEAPIVARACLLLECSHFVNRCNHGDWPNWMKLNLPGFRQAGLLHSRGQPSGYRRNVMLQRAAGRMFHQWGEAIANHMNDIMNDEKNDTYSVLHQVKDDSRKKELRLEDDSEDFLDEATVNHTGSDCPYALRMVACQLLLEITQFLRETYQYMPRAKSTRRDMGWDKQASRRWSAVLSSPGHSDRSNSRSSQGDMSHLAAHRKVSFSVAPTKESERSNSVPYVLNYERSPSDRKISFAVLGQSERSDSIHSSTTTISQFDIGSDARRLAGQRNKLLKTRRGSGHNSSFRNQHQPSFKFKRPEGGGSMRRLGSVKSRKVSTQSLQSNISIDQDGEPLEEQDSGGMMSDEAQESPDVPEQDDQDYSKFMPWIKVVVQLANTSNFICEHQSYCHPDCYERQRRSCSRLIAAVVKVYESNPSDAQPQTFEPKPDSRDLLRDKLKRRRENIFVRNSTSDSETDSKSSSVNSDDENIHQQEESMFQPSSPTHRRESTPLLEKFKTDMNAAMKARLQAALEKGKEEKKKPEKPKDDIAIVKYFKTQVQNLTHGPLAIISKSAPILADETYVDMMPVAWELLLESDQELAAAASCVFMLSSIKVPEQVQELMVKQLHHEEVNQRINAILRFAALWRFRFQVWPRMEDGANMFFKVPPPSIDFVLPSPTIGLPNLPVIDPPWTPHFKTKVEEVTINQEESKSFVTATTTRRKQQQEMIHRALLAEEDRRRAARENFHMTAVPIVVQAAYEPALHHATEDHDEQAVQEEVMVNLAARRMSVAPVNRASNVQSRAQNMSGRNGSFFWSRPTIYEGAGGEEERVEHLHSHHMQIAQNFFPSCICSAALPIIHLLEDLEVNGDGVAVCEVAQKVIWACLTEEPTMFLRTFLEKLTVRDKQEELIFLLRKMLYHLNSLPAQTAHCLFNYLVGYVMFYVRSPAEGGQEAISEALSILWQVVPSVNGIYFKDLKQTLRKEQCDPTLLVTANVPSAKKLIVHGPDLSSIPSQFPIHEDTQFAQILTDSLDFFNIPDEEHASYFLVDTKTNQMHNLNSYVRDFYFFHRNFYPQLSLVWMNPEEASKALQKQAFILKFLEIGKVMFSQSVIQASSGQQMQNHVSFLHEDLLKLPSFPRKALEAEFGLHSGEYGTEVAGLDMLHKYVWARLMSTLFRGMSSTITYAGDLPLFLNVINGTLYLHGEDTAMLRMCLSTFINAARHFKQVFATSGFMFIMPTLLRVYSNHQSNPVICEAIEFTCRQFFILHRNPFMLQMFGSIAPVLDIREDTSVRCLTKVDPEALFSLLLALENDCPDELDILEMVEGEKPLMALDFCYIDDPDTFTMIDAINLCVTVVAYASDSVRAMQMLAILEAILPYYLNHIKEETTRKDNPSAVREEMQLISNIAISMRALISSSETLSRNFNGPQRQFEKEKDNVKATQNHSNHSPQGHHIYFDEPSDIRFLHMEEGLAKKTRQQQAMEDEVDVSLGEFRKPRNSLLCVVACFFSHAFVRIKELRRLLADPSVRAPELLDYKAHNRLADIAHTLLKVAPFDPATMRSVGIQKYMLDILPITDWSQETVRPALNLIFRRLERLFSKMYKKTVLRRHMDWVAAANLLKGVYDTLAKYHYLAHLPHLKTFINVCLNIILAEEYSMSMGDSSHSVPHRSDTSGARVQAPSVFSSAVVKLTAMQMQALGENCSLEHICGGMSVFPTSEKTNNMLLNLILPLVIRMGCGRRDCPKMRQSDINFALTIILNALMPPLKSQHSGSSKSHHLSVSDMRRSSSMSSSARRAPRDLTQNVSFLGLKLMMVCFDKQLSTEWYRIAKCVSDVGGKLLGGLPLWRFIDFVVTVRTPLHMLLLPFIQYKMMKSMCETEQEYFLQQMVHQRLQGHNMPHPKCKGTLIIELAAEHKHIKEETFHQASSGDLRRGSPMSGEQAEPTATKFNVPRSSSIHDLLEQQVAARMTAIAPTLPGKKFGRAAVSATTGVMIPTRQFTQAGVGTSAETKPTALTRKSSSRISAKEGSLILEKYIRKRISQDEESNDVAPVPQSPSKAGPKVSHMRKLTRQGSIYQRSHTLVKQHIVSTPPGEEPLCESEELRSDEGETPKLQRRSHIVHWGRLKRQHAISLDSPSSSPSMSRVSESGNGRFGALKGCYHLSLVDDDWPPVFLEEDGMSPTGIADRDPLQTLDSSTAEPRAHRLQRQDAKSRKTFKIKRHRSTIKGNIIRSSTVKVGHRGKTQVGKTHSNETPAFILERMETQPEEPSDGTETEGAVGGIPAASTDHSKTASVLERAFVSKRDVDVGPKSPPPLLVETQPSVDIDFKPSARACRPRFIKSQSHDDPSADPIVHPGTARAKIARQGARIVRSRSPSTSPSRGGSLPAPTQSQAYVAQGDSVESLNVGEHSALLRNDSDSKSQSSLLICFDENEQDTCV